MVEQIDEVGFHGSVLQWRFVLWLMLRFHDHEMRANLAPALGGNIEIAMGDKPIVKKDHLIPLNGTFCGSSMPSKAPGGLMAGSPAAGSVLMNVRA
jgi:hypothetical protein